MTYPYFGGSPDKLFHVKQSLSRPTSPDELLLKWLGYWLTALNRAERVPDNECCDRRDYIQQP